MSHYSKLHVIKLHHNFSIPGTGVEDISYVSNWQHINIKNPPPMQMVHTSKEGARYTFVTVIIATTPSILVAGTSKLEEKEMFLLGSEKD